MLGLLTAYLGGSLTAAMVYVAFAHRLDVSPDADPEAEWWTAYERLRRVGRGHPTQMEVLSELGGNTSHTRPT